MLVIADETSNLEFVVSDLLSQAEHGPDSQVVLLTVNLDDSKINKIQQIVSNQTNVLPRASIISQSLTHSYILKCKDVDNALEISNLYAPYLFNIFPTLTVF